MELGRHYYVHMSLDSQFVSASLSCHGKYEIFMQPTILAQIILARGGGNKVTLGTI